MAKASKAMRCAIYTRKSSDEGLDQEFNSLDAQREAGEAYVKSQAHEGWKVISTLYDDGGFSGGSMERPALQKLLNHVDQGLIDVVIVYKIDRLTRSLPDFARIVERFDAQEVSFVSVTQSFNTTSSMGRLTLNVLLSFAQFEREVTGERIRDKIAASKAKGMWMGGVLPLGYDLPAPGTRTLVANQAEAETVREIFTRYLKLGSVHALQRELEREGVLSKQWISSKGRTMGSQPFSRGALFHLLRNPVYLGKIRHKDVVHDGEHQAILDPDLFDRVQQQLDANARRHRAAPERRVAHSPLTGKLFDANGEPMTPCFSRGSKGKHYRYYVSASLQQGGRPPKDKILRRVAAPAIEKVIGQALSRWTPGKALSLGDLLAVHLQRDHLLIDLPGEHASSIASHLSDGETIAFANKNTLRIKLAIAFPMRSGERLIIPSSKRTPMPDAKLIAALRKAHGMTRSQRGAPTIEKAPASQYDRKILRLAFLAPVLQRDILKGLQPPSLNLEALHKHEIPLDWGAQRLALGWDLSS